MRKHGRGVYYYINGDFYEGDWVNDKRKGKGKLLMDDGSEFTGDFNHDTVDGAGEFIDARKNKFVNSKKGKGFFKKGRLQGKGTA